MTIPLILEVAISMVFLYLLGSQVVLSIYELWAGYTNSRGKFLYRRLKGTLGIATTRTLYAQAPIAALTPASQAPPTSETEKSLGFWFGMDGLPAYVPADLFASTLLAMIKPSATKQTDLITALKDALQFEDVVKSAQVAADKARAEADDTQARAAKAVAEAGDARAAAITTRDEATKARAEATKVRDDAIKARDNAGIDQVKGAEAAALEHNAIIAEAKAVVIEGNAAVAEAKAATAESNATTARDKATAAESAATTAKAGADTAANNNPTWFSSQVDELLIKLLGSLNAEASLADCQKSIALWYDAYGERLTGWYKRQVRVWLFLIGLVVAFVGNIDSPFILRYLWAHPQLSSSIADTATREMQSTDGAKLRDADKKAKTLNPPTAAGTTDNTDAQTARPMSKADSCKQQSDRLTVKNDSLLQVLKASKVQIQALDKRLQVLGFPIGRADSVRADSMELPTPFYVRQHAPALRKGSVLFPDSGRYLRYARRDTLIEKHKGAYWKKSYLPLAAVPADSLKDGRDRSNPNAGFGPFFGPQSQSPGLTLLGWLVTALALSVGAPFWFDLLCRLVNIRNLGIKPPRPEG